MSAVTDTVVQRPPSFCADVKVPTTAAATVASALAASQFIFNAQASEGEWPVPPAMSALASDVLSRMLCEARARSPGLVLLHHDMELQPHEAQRFDEAVAEIVGLRFAMPVEGGTHPVPMLDSAVVRNARVTYTVNGTYAAYLKSVGAVGPSGVDLEVDIAPTRLDLGDEVIAVDGTELTMLIAMAQSHIHQRTSAWNVHAAERLGAGHLPEDPRAFGIPQAVALLRKLGGELGGCGY